MACDYLNRLVDQYHNTYHRSIGIKPVDADYSDLTEEIESSYQAHKFKVGNRVLKIGPEKCVLSILC